MSPALVKAMADTIFHRGPDDEGYYVSGRLAWVSAGFRSSTFRVATSPSRTRTALSGSFSTEKFTITRNCVPFS